MHCNIKYNKSKLVGNCQVLLILTRFSQSAVLVYISITIVFISIIHGFIDCFSLANYGVNVIVPFSMKHK